MTKSSTKELLSPLENPEQKFRSKRRLFNTPSLIESNSPKFDRISDIEEQPEEEVRETMIETMEQYISKPQGDYGSGITRPAINQGNQFELKDAKVAIQEMAEYSQKWHNGTSSKSRSTETYDGLAAIQAQLKNLRREINKVNEKVYATQVGCELCKGPHYTKDYPQKEEGKTLEEAYYT
nr:hypothetical protein [Tanacetum cinerariifolium]